MPAGVSQALVALMSCAAVAESCLALATCAADSGKVQRTRVMDGISISQTSVSGGETLIVAIVDDLLRRRPANSPDGTMTQPAARRRDPSDVRSTFRRVPLR